jgi:hypothetical protein
MAHPRCTLLLIATAVLSSSPVAARDRSNWFGRYRRALRAAAGAGISRSQRRELGDALRRAARQATTADRKDLARMLDGANLAVTRGPAGVTLEGRRYRARLQSGRLVLNNRNLQWGESSEWGFRDGTYSKIRSGNFRLLQPNTTARDTRTDRDTRLTYAVWGLATEDRTDPRRLYVIDPTVEPVGHAHTYRFKPGPGAMKTLLRATGRELARLFPEARTLVVRRWRDTAGYDGNAEKTMEYDMELFRR